MPAGSGAPVEALLGALAAGVGGEPGSSRAPLDAVVGRLAAALGRPSVHVERRTRAGALELAAAHAPTVPDPDAPPPTRPLETAGLVGEVATTGVPARVDDARADPRLVDVPGGPHRSVACVPMRLAGRVWGVLEVADDVPAAFTDDDLAAWQPTADLLAWTLEADRRRRAADRRAAHEQRLRRGLEAGAEIVMAGLGGTDVEATIDEMVREIREQLGWEGLAVLLLEGDTLRLASYYGLADLEIGRRFPADRGIIGRVATTGESYLVADVTDDPHYDGVVTDTRSELCVPLVLAGEVRGLLNAESPVPGRFTADDRDILVRIADQMALILHNVELLESEKRTVSRLHDLDQLKSRLLSIASHELRTPLTVVMGFAEVLSEHGDHLDDERRREYAGAIARQAASLSQLVDQMLLATEIEQGTLQVAVTGTDLATVVAEAMRPQHAEVIEVGRGIGRTRVIADPFRLGQVLGHLFDNAVKYAGEAGRVQLDARRTGDTVVVLLRDEGPGIPGFEHERVFQPFHQVGEHGVAGRRGVGLGLAVARDMVALMGGELKLFSAEGYGATFTLELPAAE